MENVQKKLRSLLPAEVSLNACTNAANALKFCREKEYKLILIDMVIPDVNSVALMNQLRSLQPNAKFHALMLRTENDVQKELKSQGFLGVLFKPFDSDSIDDFVIMNFDSAEVLTAKEHVLTVASFPGNPERLGRYLDRFYSRLSDMFKSELVKLAEACFETAILDVTTMPLRADKIPRLVSELATESQRVGLKLRLVGTPDFSKLLTGFADTAKLKVFQSVGEAEEAKA
jgi:CheY-like chemotaxis protein